MQSSYYLTPMAEATTQVRTLIVEDDPDSCDALRRLLVRVGHEVQCAASSSEAVAALESAAPGPDVLLLDLMLPDGYGHAVLVKARELHHNVKIAVMTAAGAQSLAVQNALALKPDALFLKPMKFADILAWLDRLPNA